MDPGNPEVTMLKEPISHLHFLAYCDVIEEAPKEGLGRAQRAGTVAGATEQASELGRKRGAGRWWTVVAKRASRRRVRRSGQAT